VVGPVTEAWFNHVSDAQVAAETRPDGFEGDDAPKLPAHESPWARTYTVPSATAPSLEITCGQVLRCTAKIAGRARELTLVRMDYHHQAVEEVTHLTGAKPVEFVFTKKIPYEPKTLFVRAGEWSGEVSVDGEQPLRQPEICDDGVDNDGNGLADCLDPACKSDAACAQLDCASPKCGGADVWKSAMCRKLNANCGPGCSCGARRRR
jgi:hypothetical protein